MKTFIIVLLASVSILACKSSTDSTPLNTTQIDSTVVRHPYDVVKGGVQIVAIQPDQKSVKGDEWMVLQTDQTVSLIGWHFNAGDVGQDYQLFSTINDSLIIFTHADQNPGDTRDTGLFLSSGKFIWNNEVPDTAKLYDNLNNLTSTFTY